MIERQYETVFFVCDSCDEETEPFGEGEFDALLAAARNQGWKIKPTGEGWRHDCSACAAISPLDRARRKFGL